MNGNPVARARAVKLPEQIWGRIATRAHDRGVDIEDILVAAINQIVEPMTVEERIIDLVRAGYPDRVIAGRTGELLARVAAVRRRAHLPANRRAA